MPVVAAAEEEVGIQQAAVILNLSRPTVVKLLDQGHIPFHGPGRRRRVRMSDLLAFKVRLEQKRAAALERLTSLGQGALERTAKHG